MYKSNDLIVFLLLSFFSFLLSFFANRRCYNYPLLFIIIILLLLFLFDTYRYRYPSLSSSYFSSLRYTLYFCSYYYYYFSCFYYYNVLLLTFSSAPSLWRCYVPICVSTCLNYAFLSQFHT